MQSIAVGAARTKYRSKYMPPAPERSSGQRYVMIRELVDTACIAQEAGSICNGLSPIIQPQQRPAAGSLLSTAQAGDVDRQQQVPGTHQQWHHSTVLSSKCQQCRADSRVDEAE